MIWYLRWKGQQTSSTDDERSKTFEPSCSEELWVHLRYYSLMMDGFAMKTVSQLFGWVRLRHLHVRTDLESSHPATHKININVRSVTDHRINSIPNASFRA